MAQGFFHADSFYIDSSGEVKMLRAVKTIPGVGVLAAGGLNQPGKGSLRSTSDTVAWRAPGSGTYGPPVYCGADDTYVLEDGEDRSMFVRVSVDISWLEDGAEGPVHLDDVYLNAIANSDVTSGQASSGNTTSYSVTMKARNRAGVSQVRVWLSPQATDLEISHDNGTWVSPTTEADALVFGEVTTAGTTLYFKRTTAASTSYDPNILQWLKFSFSAL